MSKKTMKQRIAVVAVSILGFGLLSVAPTNATSTFAAVSGVANIKGIAPACVVTNDAGTIIATTTYDATNEAISSDANGKNVTMPVGAAFVVAVDASDHVLLTGPIAVINTDFDAAATDEGVMAFNASGQAFFDNGAADNDILVSALAVGSATLVVMETATVFASTRANTINITVVAACATTGVDAANTVAQSTSLTCIVAAAVVRGADTTTFAAGNPACITAVVNNSYGVAVPSDTFTATATNGARVNIDGSTIALTTVDNRGASSFDSAATTDGTDVFVRVDNPTGAALSTTVTISYAGQVVSTKNLTWVGEATKINVVAKTVGKTSAQGQIHYTLTDAAGTLTAGIATGDVTSFGATVTSTTDTTITGTTTQPTQATAGKSATFSSAAPVAVAISGVAANPVTSGAYGIALFNCGSSAGTASVTLRHLQPVTGAYISTPVSVSCAGGVDTYTVSSNKASYNIGEVATFTITAKDSKGNPVHDYLSTNNAALGTGTAADISFGGGTITKATAITDVIGTFAGNAPGVATYKAQLTTEGSFNAVVNLGGSTTKSVTVAYTVAGTGGVTNAEVLKSIVALIASINKQITALQKLILKR